jgi:hypothetical protein
MTALSPIINRLLAVTLLLAALAAAWVFVVEPVAAKFEGYDRSISQSRELLARYMGVAAAKAQLETKLEELRRAQSAAGRFLEGGSVQLVAAQLQNTVKTLIEANGATLQSIQVLPATDQDDFPKVIIRVNMNADTEALQKIFYALEAADPYLFLDNIDTRSRRVRARRRQHVPTEGKLQVRFDVYGFMPREGP